METIEKNNVEGKKSKLDEMDVYNYTRNIFCSSKKFRPVLNLIKGQNAQRAVAILNNCSKRKCSDIIIKAINAAMANAVNNKQIEVSNLYLAEAWAVKGRTLRRAFPRAKGTMNSRQKHVSHLFIGLKKKLISSSNKENHDTIEGKGK